jgi:hypothetical protein
MKRLCLVIACLIPISASAQIDITLAEFGAVDSSGGPKDVSGFKALIGDLGSVFGPISLGPANTIGALGFDIGFDYSVSNINKKSAHWNKVFTANNKSGADAPGALSIVQLKMRKGLPYSFELGGNVGKLLDSDLWVMGLSLRYAVLEGYHLLPDIALSTGISTILGSREMSMLVSGGALTISKSFGVAGIVSLTPYFSYNPLVVRASSYVIGRFNNEQQLVRFVLAPETILRHRGAIGVRAVSNNVTLAIEAIMTSGVQTFTTQVGATF